MVDEVSGRADEIRDEIRAVTEANDRQAEKLEEISRPVARLSESGDGRP